VFSYYIYFSPNITLETQSTQEHCNKLPFQSQYEIYFHSTSRVTIRCIFSVTFALFLFCTNVEFLADFLRNPGWGKSVMDCGECRQSR
jgi:hypothetical protein